MVTQRARTRRYDRFVRKTAAGAFGILAGNLLACGIVATILRALAMVMDEFPCGWRAFTLLGAVSMIIFPCMVVGLALRLLGTRGQCSRAESVAYPAVLAMMWVYPFKLFVAMLWARQAVLMSLATAIAGTGAGYAVAVWRRRTCLW